MRQWTTTLSSEYDIDKRRSEDILKEMKRLAAAYVPEWQFDTDNPDMGSVIALLYAEQMEDNLKRYNTVLGRYYTELVNMLGISLKPAFPARSVVLMHLTEDTVPGRLLPAGVKLLGGNGEEEDGSLVFETEQPVYVTGSRLTCIFQARSSDGKVIPILGSFPPVSYVNEIQPDMEEMTEEFGGEPDGGMYGDAEAASAASAEPEAGMESGFPVTLFDFDVPGYGKYAFAMYHSHLFDARDNDITMRLAGEDGSRILDGIESGRYKLSCYSEHGFRPVTDIRRADEEVLVFSKAEECRKVREGEEELSLLLLEADGPAQRTEWVEDIRFSSSGGPQEAEVVWNGSVELEKEEFMPFGDTLNLFSEVYVGHEGYFSKAGARVTVTFTSRLEENVITLFRQKEDEELKVIKRKPKKVIEDVPAEVYADEICLEYYNGTGWRRLETDVRIQAFFASEGKKECRVSFRAPADWAATEAGGYTGHCLRMQLVAAADCYFRPAVHHYPVIGGLRISYTYEGYEERPERLVSFCGGRRRELAKLLASGKPVPVFGRNGCGKTGLYLGFDRPMEGGPVSILFRIADNPSGTQGNLSVYYSVKDGFARLKYSDSTDGLSHTGILQFMPPSDMARRTLEGQDAYWILLSCGEDSRERAKASLPVLQGVDVNAVWAANTETMETEEFYIDEARSNMSFALNARNILSADVWVNETNVFSEPVMRRMLKEQPDQVAAEYDFLGEITEFYVLWKEVDTFDLSGPSDRHYCLDRMNNRIHFGDGVHVQIPRNVTGTAFRVTLRCCSGEEANLNVGGIRGSMGNLMFVDGIYNPIRAYGGMNMESMDSALRRGTGLLGGRRRLVSTWDYEREVLSFSSNISQVKAIAGLRRGGMRDDGCISLAVLMKDYRSGSSSFLDLRPRLVKHLLTECELSVQADRLEVAEPLFVELSVDAWVRTSDMRDIFAVQTSLTDALTAYLDPAGNERWEIGQIPSRSQIELKLIMEKGKAALEHVMITARCEDENGVMHEADVDELKSNPFVLVCSGSHRIHFNER